MTFYLIVGPVLILSVFMVAKLRRLKKHDEILFRFCQLRRDLMAYLRVKEERVPKDDFFAIRELLNIVNSTIHNFDSYKTELFNVNKLFREAKSVYKSVKKIESKQFRNNTKVKSFYDEYGKIMIIAFLTYTPFLKSKIVIFLLIKLFQFLAIATGKYFNNSLNNFVRFLKWLSGEADKFNLHSRLKPF